MPLLLPHRDGLSDCLQGRRVQLVLGGDDHKVDGLVPGLGVSTLPTPLIERSRYDEWVSGLFVGEVGSGRQTV
jgi:hypothetical protein